MKIFLSEKEKREWKKILRSLDLTIEESDFWNAVLFGEIPENEWLPKAKRLSISDYIDDPYMNNVLPKECEIGDVFLRYERYRKKEGFVYDEITYDPMTYQERTPFGYFDEGFHYLALGKGDATWMSVIPHEINTMRKPIEEANGKVLTLGLGIGYYVYNVLMKKNVEEVTVVEYDKDIIDVFKKHLLPFFPNKEKLKIIEGDAFEYLSHAKAFDYCFADLWHMPEDGLPMYIKLRKYEDIHPNATFSYWIEKSMLSLIRRSLIVLFDEEMDRETSDNDYMESETLGDRLINDLHFLLKGTEIKNIADLHGFLDIEGLRELAKKLVI